MRILYPQAASIQKVELEFQSCIQEVRHLFQYCHHSTKNIDARWFLFFPLFVQLIKHFQLDAHFVEEAGESAMDQVDQVDQVVDLGSEEEETEVKENQC